MPYTEDMVMTTIGFVGGALVLLSFAGVAFGRLGAGGSTYHAMNLVGALALVAAGLPARAWPSVTVNVAWAAISLYGLARTLAPEPHPVTAEHPTIC
jgi:hypothetical protein